MTVDLYRPVSRLEFVPGWKIDDLLLEIGPGVLPQFRGPMVEYFDLLSANEMKSRYAALSQDLTSALDRIHYVSRSGDFSIVPSGRFASVASCHNIEHHPCLVGHLQQVSRVLKPGGAYVLLIPDHRFAFDQCYQSSTISDVVGAWIEKRTTHEPRKIIRQRLAFMHNDSVRHWAGDHGDPVGAPLAAAIAGLEGDTRDHIDVHAWQFTPRTFTEIVTSLYELELVDMRPELVGDTPQDSQEFCVVLRKS